MTQASRRVFLALVSGLALAMAGPAQAKDLLVFAAASLKNAAEDIGKAYAASGAGKVTYSFAASSDLAKQIENGAPAGIYISADTKWMDYLAERKLIVPDSRRDLLGNRLVLIAPADRPLAIKLAGGRPAAEAPPAGQPAGGRAGTRPPRRHRPEGA